MDTNGNSPMGLADILELARREPDNPLARTLIDSYELDAMHKANMVVDMRRLARRKSRQEQMTPREIASQMVEFDDQGKPVMPSEQQTEEPEEDDGMRMHSDNVTNIYHNEGKMTPGKIMAFAGGITAAGLTAAAITWGLMKAGAPSETAPPPVQVDSSPGAFEKDVP